MAKFTSPLEDADTSYRSVSPVQESGKYSGLADLASAGLDIYRTYSATQARAQEERDKQAKEAKQELEMLSKGRALGSATSGILDLQDEASRQQLHYENIAAQSKSFSEDGVITQEEQRALDSLQKEAARLELLDPRQRQLRINALHKRALADVANLGIQTQINDIFTPGRSASLIDDKASSPTEQMQQFLDNKYGVGQHGAVEFGREVGKANYLNNLVTTAAGNINVVSSEAYQAAGQLGQDVLIDAAKVFKTQGSIREEQATLFLGQIEAQRVQARNRLAQLRTSYAKRGIDVSTQLNAAETKMDEMFTALSRPFLDKGAFGDSVRTSKVLSDAVTSLDKLRELNSPISTENFSKILGGGSGGSIEAVTALLNTDAGVLEQMLQQNPSLGSSVDDFRNNLTKFMAATLDPASMQDAIQEGYISPALAKIGAANFGFRFADSPEQLDGHLSVFENVNFNEVGSRLDSLTSPSNVGNIKAVGGKGIKRLENIAVDTEDRILEQMAPSLRRMVEVDKSGNLFIDPKAVTVGKANASYFNNLLQKYNKYLNTWNEELGGKEQYVMSFMKEAKGEPEKEELRPLGKNEARDNKDGTISTELTVTVPYNGGWINVPSLWKRGTETVELSKDESLMAAEEYMRSSGKKFPTFKTLSEAETFARGRSSRGGTQSGELANEQ